MAALNVDSTLNWIKLDKIFIMLCRTLMLVNPCRPRKHLSHISACAHTHWSLSPCYMDDWAFSHWEHLHTAIYFLYFILLQTIHTKHQNCYLNIRCRSLVCQPCHCSKRFHGLCFGSLNQSPHGQSRCSTLRRWLLLAGIFCGGGGTTSRESLSVACVFSVHC
jgi:hypothetical protein